MILLSGVEKKNGQIVKKVFVKIWRSVCMTRWRLINPAGFEPSSPEHRQQSFMRLKNSKDHPDIHRVAIFI